MLIEHRHDALSTGIERPTREKIDRFSDELNFLAPIDRGVKKLLHACVIVSMLEMLSIGGARGVWLAPGMGLRRCVYGITSLCF